MARAKSWACQRQTAGVKCKQRNASRRRKCSACGKLRPPRKRQAHMAALDLPYEEYVRINGGEFCGICGAGPKPGRRLNRDHAHEGNGTPRGLLCIPCNRFLVKQRYGLKVTPEWLRAAAEYMERSV